MTETVKKSGIKIGTLALMNVAAVLSLRNLPSEADYGYDIIFYIVAASICFFLPSALVSAELASGWRQDGGVYLWVKEAFGPKWGFVAIFMQWVENLPWFPAVLTFVGSAIAYVFKPELAGNKWFIFITIIVTLWLSTYLNFKGMRLSAFLSSSGALLGTLIPGVLIIVASGAFLLKHQPAIPFAAKDLLPDLSSWNQWMLLAGMMVAISGMEMSAVHVTEVDNPRRNFPRAIFIACGIIITLSILGALAVAWIIPPSQLSFAAGVCQAFDKIFVTLNVGWLTPIVCFLLAYGALTMVITWVLAPSKGVLQVAQEGYLPKYWQKRNKQGMPVRILVIQAVLSSLLSILVLVMPSISSAFWVMSALTAQLYMVMYMFMFAAAIKLRYSQPKVERPYRIPGGKPGIWIVAGIAFLTSFLAILTGFIPPSNVMSKGADAILLYIAFLLFGTLFFIAIPVICYHHYYKKNKVGEAAPAGK